jgi:hypothetical protein
MDKNISLEPDPRDRKGATYSHDVGRARVQGAGFILAIVTVAVLLIVGMVYIWQPVVEQIAAQ